MYIVVHSNNPDKQLDEAKDIVINAIGEPVRPHRPRSQPASGRSGLLGSRRITGHPRFGRTDSGRDELTHCADQGEWGSVESPRRGCGSRPFR